MSKRLIPTNLETQYGRLIYEDPDTKEKHSELSITFPWKSGWVNMPSIHRGILYSEDELKNMLKNNSIWLESGVTNTYPNEMEALRAAEYRSNNMQSSPAKNVMQSFGNLNILNEKTFGMIIDDIKKNKKKKEVASVKPVFTFKGDIKPKPSVKLIKDAKVDYGPIPGFKRPLDSKGNKQGYYDADEKSEFWKTDAGYEKAMETWGKDGGVLPQFVKKPKQKEFNMSEIKKLFTINN